MDGDGDSVWRVARRSRVLVPSTLTCLSTLPTINLTVGCLHDCAYCYIRGYTGYPGPGKAVLYSDTAERLERELQRAKAAPHAVYFSPSSDLFQPHAAILECTERVVRLLLEHGVGVAFLTKGQIPESILNLLSEHDGLVQAQVGLISLDDAIAQTFEPGAAPTATRVEQMRRLVLAGIPTTMRIDPVLPGITDRDDQLQSLFAAARAAGVSRATAGVLTIRPAILGGIRRATGPCEDAVPGMLARFGAGERITMRGAGTSVGVLPLADRRAIFDRLRAAALAERIELRICACKNPDLASGSCGIAGRWPSRSARPRQGTLPWIEPAPARRAR